MIITFTVSIEFNPELDPNGEEVWTGILNELEDVVARRGYSLDDSNWNEEEN
jgi:hypothetical protein